MEIEEGDISLGFGMSEGEEGAKEREEESVVGGLLVLVEAAVEAAVAMPVAVAETS